MSVIHELEQLCSDVCRGVLTGSHTPGSKPPKYVVMTSRAKMPGSCKYGPYNKVAVVKTTEKEWPTSIDPRSSLVEDVIWKEDRLWEGKSMKSAYAKALIQAREVADSLL